ALAHCPHKGRRHLDRLVLDRLLGAQAERDLFGERDVDRILFPRRSVLPLHGLDRRERPRVYARRSLGKGGRALGRISGAGFVEPPVTGKAPGPVDEDPHADPFALDVVDLVDAPILGRDELRAPNHRAGIGVGRTAGERRGDSFFTQRPHRPNPNAEGRTSVATIRPARWWRNW